MSPQTAPPATPSSSPEAPLRVGPPPYGKMLLALLSALLMLPVGLGAGRMFGSCGGEDQALARAEGEEIDLPTVMYQVRRAEGFGRGARSGADTLPDALRRSAAVYLLAAEAERRAITLSPAELAAYLKDPRQNSDLPYLLAPNGQFQVEHYQKAVAFGLHWSVRRYEDFKRREALARRALVALGPEFGGTSEAWLFAPGAQPGSGPSPALGAWLATAQAEGRLELHPERFEQKGEGKGR